MKLDMIKLLRSSCLGLLMVAACDDALMASQSALMRHAGTLYAACVRGVRSVANKIDYGRLARIVSPRVAKIGGVVSLAGLVGIAGYAVLHRYRARVAEVPSRITHIEHELTLPEGQVRENLVRPRRVNGKFYNEDEHGNYSRKEPYNCLIDSVFIGLSTKIHDFGVALKRLLNRTHEPDHGDLSVQEVPNLREQQPQPNVPTITWIGHSSFLIQINGLNILTDIIFGDLSAAYKRRVRPVITPENLPQIDVVLLSHNHRDHMDEKSLLAIKHNQPLVLVPTNNGSWFRKNGFNHVVEKSWWESEQVSLKTDTERVLPVTITCVPAQHWSTRMLLWGNNDALCSGWYIKGGGYAIHFFGDTGYKQSFFRQIRETLGAPDVALVPIGPNDPRSFMNEAHMSTEQAVDAVRDLLPGICIPMHHATFGLGIDPIDGPKKRLQRLAPEGVIGATRVLTNFKFGQRFRIGA